MIVPSLLPDASATTSVLDELPELLNVTLIVSLPETGTLTARYDVLPPPPSANACV